MKKNLIFRLVFLLQVSIFTSLVHINAHAQNLGVGVTALETKDYSSALRNLLPLAEKGNPDAQVFIAYMYENGFGVEKNYKEAFNWYEIAATKNQPLAQFNLAFLYKNGLGVAKSDKQAALWYERAANNGFSAAQNNLGYMYEKGVGVSRNYSQAAYWYQKAMEQGNKSAQINLAFLHENGLGISKNIPKAVDLYEKALMSAGVISQSEVTFVQKRLDVLRTNVTKKDLNAPAKPAPILAEGRSGKEIYSEVQVAPDISQASISRLGKSVATSKSDGAIPSSSIPTVAAIAPSTVTAASSKTTAAVPTVTTTAAAEAATAKVTAAAAPITPTTIAAPATVAKKEQVASATGIPATPPISSATSGISSPINVTTATTAVNQGSAMPLPVDVKPITNNVTTVASANENQNMQTIKKPIANSGNFPLYGADGNLTNQIVSGTLALKGIQNDYEDFDKNFWLAKATVSIVDPENGFEPYAKGGVTVRGYFDPTGGDAVCVTDNGGRCTLTSAKIRTTINTVRLKVYSVRR